MIELKNLIDHLEAERIKWVKINLIGFIIWYGTGIIARHLLVFNPIIGGISFLGVIVWLVSLIRLNRLSKKVKNNKQLIEILNDELIIIDRFKAWRTGLIAALLTQVLILMASFIFKISGILAAEITIFVTVTACIGSFIFYHTRANGRI